MQGRGWGWGWGWDESARVGAAAAFHKLFPDGRGMSPWTASAVTAREWRGTEDGLRSSDTRLHFKNRAEYHGIETYAWQYLVTSQYSDAMDHFYAAAFWRANDMGLIAAANSGAEADDGHIAAVSFCLRMARFAQALAHAANSNSPFPRPGDFGLDERRVAAREKRAQGELDAFREADAGPKRWSYTGDGPLQDP